MTLESLTTLLGWCSLINAGFLLAATAFLAASPELAYRSQTIWVKVPRVTILTLFYGWIAVFKIFWIVFNVVPWAVLRFLM